MAAPDAALLRLHELAARRGGRLVVDGVEATLHAGDALVLRGPNGSGKSTLLRVLAGLLRPERGRITWRDRPVAEDRQAHRARLHYVAHADAVKTGLTTAENLAFAAALGQGRDELDAALSAMDLRPLAELPARFLSAGQRRRLALARLLASPRPLWLLDEPGVGLDRASRDRLEAAIGTHRAAGGVCVVATHGDVAIPNALRLELAG